MSNEKALSDVTIPAHRAIATLGTGGIPAIVPQTMDEVWRFSQVLAKSGLLPKGIETPEQVTVQILTGFELGLKPLVAVQNIAVINGRPSIGGDLALAVLMTSGLLEDHDEWIDGEGNDRVAVCKVQRKGMKPIERRFSVKDAIQAGLWETQAMVRKTYWDKNTNQRKTSNYETPNESPWFRYQERMLKMRARGFAFRDRFPDVLKGMHLAEEMMGHEEIEPSRASPAAAIESPPPPPPEDEKPESKPAEHPTAPPVEDAEFTETAGSPSPDTTDDEPFDPEAWLQEASDLFATCRATSDVDQAHETLEGTVEENLSLTDRQKYQDIHEAALARVKDAAAPPAKRRFFINPETRSYFATEGWRDGREDAQGYAEVREHEFLEFKGQVDQDGSPGAPPPENEAAEADAAEESLSAHREWLLGKLNAPGMTPLGLADLWADTKPVRVRMVEAGKMTGRDRKVLYDEVDVIHKGLLAAAAARAATTPGTQSEEPPAPPAESAPSDGIAGRASEMTDRLRDLLEAAEDAEACNRIGVETFPDRARLLEEGAGKIMDDLWRRMVKQRRDALSGI